MFKYEVYVGEGTDAPIHVTDDAADAYWAMVRALGAPCLASATTMKAIRYRLIEQGATSESCNGVFIRRVDMVDSALLDDLFTLQCEALGPDSDTTLVSDERSEAMSRVLGALLDSDTRRDVLEATLEAAGFHVSNI